MMNKKANKYYRMALADVARRYPDATPEELEEEAIAELREWAQACPTADGSSSWSDNSADSYIQNCDDAGTGEGQFHGRI